VGRNLTGNDWTAVVVYGYFSLEVVREVQSLGLLCKNFPSMASRSEEHCSQNWIFDHGVGPAFAGDSRLVE
jgi:hypothetical protein